VAYLAWVEEQGGPKRSHGLRDELLAAVMENTLSKLTPTVEYPDDAATVIAEVEHRELGRVEMSGWFERFAYIQNDDAYFDMEDRREVMRKTFNALFRHINCKSRHGKHPKVEASVSFDEYRQDKGARALVGITYAAGESVLVAREGLVYGNRWRDARPQPVAGDVSAWLRHVERMVPIEFEREHLLNALAHKVQFPSHKINHAILLGGNHGSGKDTLFAPSFKILIVLRCAPSSRLFFGNPPAQISFISNNNYRETAVVSWIGFIEEYSFPVFERFETFPISEVKNKD
jgi:hypothetical protein